MKACGEAGLERHTWLDYGFIGPKCLACTLNYPDEADHESCAEVQIALESGPMLMGRR